MRTWGAVVVAVLCVLLLVAGLARGPDATTAAPSPGAEKKGTSGVLFQPERKDASPGQATAPVATTVPPAAVDPGAPTDGRARLRGSVVDGLGRGLAGVTVIAQRCLDVDPGPAVVTDAGGGYSHVVELFPAGEAASFDLSAKAAGCQADAVRVGPTRGGDVAVPPIVLQREAIIRGVMKTAAGLPAAGMVALYSRTGPNKPIRYARADADGSFAFTVPEAVYDVSVLPEDAVSTEAHVVALEGSVTDVSLVVTPLRRRTLAVAALGPDGHPVATGARFVVTAPAFARQVETHESRHSFHGVPEGPLEVAAITRGRPEGEELAGFAAVPPGAARAEVMLGPGLRLPGRVVDTLGRPVAAALVTATGKRVGGSASTAPDGRFVLAPLLDDAVDVVVRLPSERHDTPGVLLHKGLRSGADPVDLVVPVAASIDGRVSGAEPVERVRLEAIVPDGDPLAGSYEAPTEEGRFTFEGVAPGRYAVSVGEGLVLETPLVLEVAPGARLGTVELRLAANGPGPRVRGKVRGLPLGAPALHVIARGEDSRYAAGATTDPLGAFTLEGLRPRGAWTVTVDREGSAPALELLAAKLGAKKVSFTTATVVATPGGEREIELVLVRDP